MDEANWPHLLHDARRQLGLTQADLAARTGISVDTIRAYETGRRHPSRARLDNILSALQVDRGWRNRIVVAAGYAPDGLELRPANISDWWLTLDQAQDEVDTYPWPSFVVTERGEVAAANGPLQTLLRLDLSREAADPLDRNLLCIAITPQAVEHIVNWDEAMRIVLRTFKSFHRGPETLEAPSPYFAALLDRFTSSESPQVGRFLQLWREASDEFPPRIRWAYPIHWREAGCDVRFHCIVSAGNEADGLSLNDWMPVGEGSWESLARILAAREAAGGG